jgi:hypothetical protein
LVSKIAAGTAASDKRKPDIPELPAT